MEEVAKCEMCGEPMPEGEQMFKFHGYSGPCPKPPLPRPEPKTFSQRNRERSEAPNGFNHKLDSWSLSDWITATTGELGEAANIVKKLNRVRDGNGKINKESASELWKELADEIADVSIYLDLLAQSAGFDLETIREAKFQKTSKKIGYVER